MPLKEKFRIYTNSYFYYQLLVVLEILIFAPDTYIAYNILEHEIW